MLRLLHSHAVLSKHFFVWMFWIFLFPATACLSQITANAAQGASPYAVYNVGDIDNVNILNGNVFVKIPLLSYPQRGKDLTMNFYIYANDKQWYIGNYQGGATYTGNWTGAAFTTGITPEPLVGAYVARDQDLAFGVDTLTSTSTGGGEPYDQYTITTTNNGFYAITGDGSKHYVGDIVYLRCQAQGSGSCPSIPNAYGNQYPATDATGYLPISIGFPGSTTNEVKDPNGVDYKAVVTNPQLPTFSAQTTQTDRNGNLITINNNGWTDTVGRAIPGSYSGPGGVPGDEAVASAPSEPIPGTPLAQGQVGNCPSGTAAARDWAVPAHDGSTQHYYLCYQNFAYQTAFNLDQVLNTTLYEGVYEASSSNANNEPALLLTAVVLPNSTSYTFSYDQYLSLTQINLPTGGSIAYTWQNIAFDPFNGTRPISRAIETRTLTPGNGQPAETWTYHWLITYAAGNNGTSYISYPMWHIVTDPAGNDVEHQLNREQEQQTVYYSGCGPHDTASNRTCSGSGVTLKTLSYAYTEYDSGGYTFGTPASIGPGLTDPLFRATTTTTTLPTSTSGQSLVSQEVIALTPKYGTCDQYYGYNGSQPEYQVVTPCYSVNQNQSVTEYDYGSNSFGSVLREDSYQYLWQDTSLGASYIAANLLNPLESHSVVTPTNGSPWSVTTFGYDENNGSPQGALGNLTSTTTAAGKSQTVYNLQGMPTLQIDPKGNKTSISSYQCSGAFPQNVIRPYQSSTTLAETTSYVYDCNTGKVTSITDPNNEKTSFVYNHPLNRLTTIGYPDVYPGSSTYGQTTYTYADTASPVHVTVAETMSPTSTRQTEYDVDGLGRLIHTKLISAPGSPDITDTNYDSKGRVSSVSNPYQTTVEGATQYFYDGLDRLTKQIQADGSSYLQWCFNGIATNGQTNCTANKSSKATASWVDYSDENGSHWQRASDALARLTAIMEPDGSLNITATPTLETDYTYDPLNNLTRVSQTGGSLVRSFSYDSLSRLITANNPESGLTCYGTWSGGAVGSGTCQNGYDSDSNLVARTDARGKITSYSYDALNRLIAKTYSDTTPPAHYNYDETTVTVGNNFWSGPHGVDNGMGRLTSWYVGTSAPGLAMKTYTYDAKGRPVQSWQCWGTTECTSQYGTRENKRTYDLVGNVTYVDNSADASFSYTYDGAGRMDSVSYYYVYPTATTIPLITLATYTAWGAPLTRNGNETWGYDARMRVSSYTNKPSASSSTVNYGYSLTYQPNSNVQTAAETSGNKSWTYSYNYDNLNRLYTAISGQLTEGCEETYDAFGNRSAQNPVGRGNSCGSFSASFTGNGLGNNNRIDGYCYDAAGDLLDAGPCPTSGNHMYTYDAEGRMATALNGATVLTYGADGKLATATLSGTPYNYVYDYDGSILAHYDYNSPLSTETWVNGQHFGYTTPGSTSTPVVMLSAVNWLGTERAHIDQAGNLEATFCSLPFGEMQTVCQGSDPYTDPTVFTGKERDPTSGLDNFGARYFGSSMGRFMSPDELGGHLDNPQTLNKYSYVENNPLSLTDPTGLDFSLGCAQNNGTTCQGGNTYYQDKNGNYQQTVVKSDSKGNLTDQSGNSYTANVSGAGVSFTGGASNGALGTFINGTNPTTINGSGGLSGFTFNFTYSEASNGITAGGSFTYSGNADSAAKALQGAGFTHYWEDRLNGEHPSVKGVYNAVDYRSAGDPKDGANSGHFTLHVPVGQSGPSSVGDLHLGEHNPYTTVPGFLDHAQEVIKHHLDH